MIRELVELTNFLNGLNLGTMNLMHDPLRLLLTEALFKAISNLNVNLQKAEIYNQLVEPPNTDLGHLAFGCFILAKNLKKAPAASALELKALIGTVDQVTTIEAAGPYLNFKFSSQILADKVVMPAITMDLFKRKLTEKNPKGMIEYSQPNRGYACDPREFLCACLAENTRSSL